MLEKQGLVFCKLNFNGVRLLIKPTKEVEASIE